MLFPSKIEDFEYDCFFNNEICKMKLSDIKTKYIILLFYPHDFTFVCPTEIVKHSELHDEILKQNATVIYVSTDSVFCHKASTLVKVEDGGIGLVKWPMISDIRHLLSSQFNLFNEKTGAVMRSTVILNNELEVLHMSANVDYIGRSTSEILRLLKALNHNTKTGNYCYVDYEE